MPRSLLVGLCVLTLVSGCTASRQVSASRSSPDELAQVTASLTGRTVAIRMVLETDHGRFVEALADSTRWVRRDGSLRTVATSELRSIYVEDGGSRALGGAALGGLAGAALIAGAGDQLNDEDASLGDVFVLGFTAVVVAPVLVGVGLAGGASMGNSYTVWIRP